jgi:hypothetical protein
MTIEIPFFFTAPSIFRLAVLRALIAVAWAMDVVRPASHPRLARAD